MSYKLPFHAAIAALYSVLNQSAEINLSWFDCSRPILEIEQSFANQVEIAYGIIGESEADCVPNKDVAIWKVYVELELYSNYQGRAVIISKMERLLNYLSSDAGWAALTNAMAAENFKLDTLTFGKMNINLPIFSDKGTWQSGHTTLDLRLIQI